MIYPMKVVRSRSDDNAFDIIGQVRGELIVRELATEQAAYNWIDENARDWPPNYAFAKRRKRA